MKEQANGKSNSATGTQDSNQQAVDKRGERVGNLQEDGLGSTLGKIAVFAVSLAISAKLMADVLDYGDDPFFATVICTILFIFNLTLGVDDGNKM